MLNSKNVKNHMGMIGIGSEILIKHLLRARPQGGVLGTEHQGSPVLVLTAAQPEREAGNCPGPLSQPAARCTALRGLTEGHPHGGVQGESCWEEMTSWLRQKAENRSAR